MEEDTAVRSRLMKAVFFLSEESRVELTGRISILLSGHVERCERVVGTNLALHSRHAGLETATHLGSSQWKRRS